MPPTMRMQSKIMTDCAVKDSKAVVTLAVEHSIRHFGWAQAKLIPRSEDKTHL